MKKIQRMLINTCEDLKRQCTMNTYVPTTQLRNPFPWGRGSSPWSPIFISFTLRCNNHLEFCVYFSHIFLYSLILCLYPRQSIV